MIVEPDFLTHWKTRALILALGDEAAGLYVLSLWAHCQNRKTDRFILTASRFAQVCSYPCADKSDKFLSAMIECGWIDREGDALIAHGWAEANAKMYANWQNGMFGGRKPNPQGTHSEPKTENHELASTDKSRVDKIRIEKKGASNGSTPTSVSDDDWLKQISSEPCYSHVRVRDEHGKMLVWCRNQRPPKQPNRRRFLNWLNKIERPMQGAVPAARSAPVKEIPDQMRTWLIDHYNEKREQIQQWQTMDHVPPFLRDEWFRYRKERKTE